MAEVVLIALFDEWCFGLRQIQAQLKRHGHATDLVFVRGMEDLNVAAGPADDGGYHCAPASVTRRELDLLQEFLRQRRPRVVGLGHTSNFTGLAARVVREARTVLPDSTFVFGGVEATVNPALALEDCDYVCRGEGEAFVLELLACLARGESPTGLPNLAWRDESGRVVENELRPTIADLDRLPPFDFEAGDKYLIRADRLEADALPPASTLRHVYATMTGRGCPFRCTYCCNSVYSTIYEGQYLRRHSVDYSIHELYTYIQKHPEAGMIEFYDDVFTINPKWLKAFAAEYKRTIGLPFCCYSYPSLVEREMLAMLKDAGLHTLWMGIQSGSERTLSEVYERKGTQAQVIEAVKTIHAVGVDLLVDLIGTSAVETAEDKHATIDLLTRMDKPFRISGLGPLSFYARYPIMDKARAAGVELRLQPGRHVYLAEQTNEDRFYNSLSSICQYPLARATVLKLEAMDALHAHPDLVRALEGVLECATYFNASRLHKDYVIERLAARLADLRAQLRQARRSLAFRLGAALAGGNGHETHGGAPGPVELAVPSAAWEAFARMFRMHGGGDEALEALREMACFGADEALLRDLAQAMMAGAFVAGTPVRKDDVIARLMEQIEGASAQLRRGMESGLYRKWSSIHARLGRLAGRGSGRAAEQRPLASEALKRRYTLDEALAMSGFSADDAAKRRLA